VSIVGPAETPLVDAAANLRRSTIVAACLGAVGVLITSLLGHPLMGAFFVVGLGLGALNTFLLQNSVVRYSASPTMGKAQFSRKVLLRLVGITAISFGFALFIRPDGLGIFAGLAIFQVLMLVGAAVPVFRSLRHS
jgi:hypothetical protein